MIDMLDVHLLGCGIDNLKLEEILCSLNACIKKDVNGVGSTERNVLPTNSTKTVTDTSR